MDQKQKASGSDALIAQLDLAESIPEMRELRMWSYELLGIAADVAVVDVGCGAGRAVAEMGMRGAQVVGIDPDERMISLARERWPGEDFRMADAYGLPFVDGALRGYRADKVYHAVDDPARAIDEARRVLASGGRIVVVGQDWDTFIIDSDDAALTRRIVHARADMITEPRVVRRLPRLLAEAGFVDVSVEAHMMVSRDAAAVTILADMAAKVRSVGAISEAEADGWVAEQRERGRDGRLFFALPMFVTAATRL
ncbi:methyltransferase domain-containing protein [Actinomadura sp. KC06]|uniref:methyltransferase domain-containing protein n=1 Tax=Actinomadura sp. KC06 TaxID=2530369 RepID=UPI0010531CA1|nr:methyltransferase domain-containing protein [Actinomadura sp. KC06]TDD27212.1 methyltransferase domain-containing protein [Actinomadura sp. KC06]